MKLHLASRFCALRPLRQAFRGQFCPLLLPGVQPYMTVAPLLSLDPRTFSFSQNRMASSSSVSPAELLRPKSTVAQVTSVTPLETGRFVNLKRLEYTNPLGKSLVWEMATRPTKPADSPVDAVVIVPVLHYPDGTKKLALVRQFRPPTGGVCIEFPAGLVDPNDSLEGCALRELREECGLHGTVRSVSGPCFSDPGLCDATCVVIHCDVDMELDANKNPVPQWMDNEVIEVVYVDVADLSKDVEQWRKEGYTIDAKVEAVIVGFALAI